jgi:hypothetical protein
MDDDLEWTEEAVEPPDSSIVSNHDIDSLLAVLLCPFFGWAIDIFEFDKSDGFCPSWLLFECPFVMGEDDRRGERGGGIYKLSMGGARVELISVIRSLIGDFE